MGIEEVSECSAVTEGDLLILSVRGRFGFSAGTKTKELFSEHYCEGITRVLFDLTEVSYVTSSGMRGLFTVYRKLAPKGAKIAIASGAAGVLEVLRLSGVGEIFRVFSSCEEARKSQW